MIHSMTFPSHPSTDTNNTDQNAVMLFLSSASLVFFRIIIFSAYRLQYKRFYETMRFSVNEFVVYCNHGLRTLFISVFASALH